MTLLMTLSISLSLAQQNLQCEAPLFQIEPKFTNPARIMGTIGAQRLFSHPEAPFSSVSKITIRLPRL
jgi:hypothetical protein